jgi:starch-binding outer membrane protein, SusD/RagB family
MICIATLGACKDFLEEKQVSSLTQDFYNTETGLESLVKGLYLYSRVKHEWDANGARLIEPETDAYMTVNATYARANASAYGSDVSNIASNMVNYIGAPNTNTTAPMGAYPHINNCNIALAQIDEAKPGKFGTDPTFNAQRKGEVLFLRAWAYYLISNQLGDVPLLLKPKYEDNGVYYYPKSSLTDIYTRIIADLRVAYDNLPLTQVEQGRVTKAAAGHFLAKLYLNRAQAAPFQNSALHLAMLYKGTNPTDLDSAIYYRRKSLTPWEAPEVLRQTTGLCLIQKWQSPPLIRKYCGQHSSAPTSA